MISWETKLRVAQKIARGESATRVDALGYGSLQYKPTPAGETLLPELGGTESKFLDHVGVPRRITSLAPSMYCSKTRFCCHRPFICVGLCWVGVFVIRKKNCLSNSATVSPPQTLRAVRIRRLERYDRRRALTSTIGAVCVGTAAPPRLSFDLHVRRYFTQRLLLLTTSRHCRCRAYLSACFPSEGEVRCRLGG